jgi:small subunit ribosomal protein S2
VREARRLGLPVVALVDTNCDPDEADYVIPGNDDAIKSCDLVIRTIADSIEAGKQKVKPEEFSGQAAAEPEQPAGEPEPPAAEPEPAAQPPVRASGPVEGDSGEPGGSPGGEEAVVDTAAQAQPAPAAPAEEVPAE